MENDIDIVARWILWAAYENYFENFWEMSDVDCGVEMIDAIAEQAATYMPTDPSAREWREAMERIEALDASRET